MKVSNYMYIVVAALGLMVLSFFTGRWTYNSPPIPVPQDSVYTTKPSIKEIATSAKFEIKFNPVKPTVVEEWNIANFDTTVVSGKDTVTSKTMVKSSRRSDSILIEQDIQVRKTETTQHDTTYVIKYEPHLVPVDVDRGLDTFYMGALIASVVYLIIGIIASL